MKSNPGRQKSIRAAVVGATGYTGAELVRILVDHPFVELTCITSRQHAGMAYSKVYPAFEGVVDLVCEEMNAKAVCQKADIVFTALPHKLPMSLVPDFLENGLKVIDLSADFRFENPEEYQAHYQPHTAPHLLEEAVYGLTEIYREKVAKARLVGNPGCYPTCSLLPLIPFVKEGLILPNSIVIDAKSGASGAGRSLATGSLFCEVHEGFKPYKATTHRHNPEIEQILCREAGRPVVVTFVPHLLPMSRGMLATTYASLKDDLAREDAEALLRNFYKGSPFVRIFSGDYLPLTRNVRGTNFVDIALRVDKRANRLILVSAIDNLVKGASGQAVQNANVMLNLPETAGLDRAPQGI
ncbi:MAG: N-acetyl-gamma-glutamyl-phosphate reductase [Desulfatibacillaceae bacterium]|nr:N-acetyl-gamma-glutamyl-phosphate reductase [Desulfatibacillaceae bacterium]